MTLFIIVYILGYLGFIGSIIDRYDLEDQDNVKKLKILALSGLVFYLPIFIFFAVGIFLKSAFIFIRDLRD